MNRTDAEKAARAGAKVRHSRWLADSWVTFMNGGFFHESLREFSPHWWGFDEFKDGWSIIPDPAPTASPDFEARLAAVEAWQAEFDRKNRIAEPPRHPSAESLTGAMGVMTDEAIWRNIMTRPIMSTDFAVHEAIRHTRASVIAEIEAWGRMGSADDERAAMLVIAAVRK